tara:strand:- start:695 stop:1126 length:432 start_codon:yes stop_codon:yes gene_type:complete
MKNTITILFSLVCFYSQSQVEENEVKQRWEVKGSNINGSLLLKLEGSDLYKLSFKNHLFFDKHIKSIYLSLSDLKISNLYIFLLNSFNLNGSEQNSLKIDKYEFQVSKKAYDLKVDIIMNKSNEIVGRMLIKKNDLNNLFGNY